MTHFYRLKRRGQEEKMGNRGGSCNLGHSHRSQLEIAVCQMIQARERAGEIKLIQVEDHIYLTQARIHYIPDFRCLDQKTGEEFWIEAKGFANERWPMKKKLWKFYGPGRLEIWMGTWRSPFLKETIIPQREE